MMDIHLNQFMLVYHLFVYFMNVGQWSRPPASNKAPALGSTAPSNTAGKAGNKKMAKGSGKDSKQGNILSFFKKVWKVKKCGNNCSWRNLKCCRSRVNVLNRSFCFWFFIKLKYDYFMCQMLLTYSRSWAGLIHAQHVRVWKMFCYSLDPLTWCSCWVQGLESPLYSHINFDPCNIALVVDESNSFGLLLLILDWSILKKRKKNHLGEHRNERDFLTCSWDNQFSETLPAMCIDGIWALDR